MNYNSAIVKIAMVLCLLTSVSGYGWAQTTPPPSNNPPDAVLALAHQAVELWGRTPTPTYTSHPPNRPSAYTGHMFWGINYGLLVGVDADQLQVTCVEGVGDDDAIEAAYAAGTPYAVSAEQASSAVLSLNQKYGVCPGDWRVTDEHIYLREDKSPIWTMNIARYVAGFPSWEDRVAADVNPYTGVVDYWGWFNGATTGQHIAPATILTIDQARQYAQTAFNDYVADILAQSPNIVVTNRNCSFFDFAGPAWQMLSTTSTDSRLAYTFIFDISEEASGEGTKGQVSAVVDAETGEVWHISWDTAGAVGGKLKTVPPSPRWTLLPKLYRDKTAYALALSIAIGKPAKATVPSKAATRFTRTIGGKPVAFALNAQENRLTWEMIPGQWSGVALPPAQTRAVQAWLNIPANATATAKSGTSSVPEVSRR